MEPRLARLRGEAGGGAWCPQQVLTNTSTEWLQVSSSSLPTISTSSLSTFLNILPQVDLGLATRVTGVISQGRWDRGLGQEWAPSLLLQTAQPGAGWVAEGGPREANTDTFTPVLSR